MAQLPTPPASRQNSEAPEAELKKLQITDTPSDLVSSLDALLERYLHLLDLHQKIQGELASKLSSGFLSLAHANYTCPPGRRYGADYYDERMKATRRMILQPPRPLDKDSQTGSALENVSRDTYPSPIFSITPPTRTQEEEGEPKTEDRIKQPQPGGKAGEDGHVDEDSRSSTESNDDPQDPSETSKPAAEEGTAAKPVKKRARSSDPIRWYGILVPPSLRSAQKSFTEAVEGDVPELASVVVEMQVVEKEIARLRRELGRE